MVPVGTVSLLAHLEQLGRVAADEVEALLLELVHVVQLTAQQGVNHILVVQFGAMHVLPADVLQWLDVVLKYA